MEIVSGLSMVVFATLFVISWSRLKGEFKDGYGWAILAVPLSLFFDVLKDNSCKWRYINLLSAFLLPVTAGWFLYAVN